MTFNTQTTIDQADFIQAEIDAGALFVCNHSGGKDSQAMYAVITSLVPAEQIVVVHADLLSADWAGLQDHIIANIDHDLVVAKAVSGRRGTSTEKDKDFFDMVEKSHDRLAGKSSPWPSPGQRQCTSDLKRTPIEVEVRRMMKEGGYLRAVNCMGIRAQESDDRELMDVVKHNKAFDAATIDRTVTDFLPIHDLDIEDVWKIIEASGQRRHFAYDLGMSRLSCCFCIYGSDADLKIAAENNPELYRRYVEMERKTGFTFKMDRKGLEEHTGIAIDTDDDPDDGEEARLQRIAELATQTDEEYEELMAPPAARTITDHRAQAEGFISHPEANDRRRSWYAEVDASTGNADKTILSLFDTTGAWSQPWREAGYNVITFDLQDGQDVNDFSVEYFYENFEFCGDVVGILAACPCTDFASSGAQYFKTKDADGRTEASIELVAQTLRLVELFRPDFWVIENPVGRMEKLCGLPSARMSFDPHHFGDAYTKKTMLWGKFNAELPLANVEPVQGSKMMQYGGSSQATKNARSETPEGFAYSFFVANHLTPDDNEEDLDAFRARVEDNAKKGDRHGDPRLGTTKTMTLESQAWEKKHQAELEDYRQELSRANERTAA